MGSARDRNFSHLYELALGEEIIGYVDHGQRAHDE
jgi:hypothetical protein